MSGPPPPGRRLRAQAVHRIGPADVGRRVSLRRRVQDATGEHASDPFRGHASDVVGRLLGVSDGVLTVVDRHGQLHVIADGTVVASKVVPEHPRRPAEPADLGTRERPLPRDAARVLVVDEADRVLLGAHRPSPGRRVWTAPGGGLQPGETHLAAADRELREELGRDVPVGPWVWTRRVTFTFAGIWLDQTERWFLSRTLAFDVDAAPLDDIGLDEVRWWSLSELRSTAETLAPHALADHLADLLRLGPPEGPIDVSAPAPG